MRIPKSIVIIPVILAALAPTASRAQDVSPLRSRHVWQPMTGVTDKQMADARAAGYDTLLAKVAPPVGEADRIDFTKPDKLIGDAAKHGMKSIVAILGWVGLENGKFWDTEESGEKIMGRLDPFWPEAMQRIEWYHAAIIDHYKADPRVIVFAPTWGIYGEAGFTSFTAGRSTHALARFNEWRANKRLAPLDAIPNTTSGPNTEFNRFVQFRYEYMERAFDAMIRRLKARAGDKPVGTWQELTAIPGYLWTMVEVPSADFALLESCFPSHTTHHPEKSLAETMGFRYQCASAADYRDYYLPLLARKRGEGGRFMGCQLSNDYATNYGWTEEKARQIAFDRWEDEFSPYLKKLMAAPLESPKRDVLLVFPTYACAALSYTSRHCADQALIDVTLRMYGCQMERCGSPRLDKMSAADMSRFKLIVIPDAAFVLSETLEKLRKTRAKVLMTGCFAQAVDGDMTPAGQTRSLWNVRMRYFDRPPGTVSVAADHALTRGLRPLLRRLPVKLAEDESFDYQPAAGKATELLRCGGPLLSTLLNGRVIVIHGHLFAAACDNPKRVPPKLGGSADPSANNDDGWGPYDAKHPQNEFGYALMKNILDYAGVDYRVSNPRPRTLTRYLGDNMEQTSISANIAYNNTGVKQRLTVRLPFKPRNYSSRLVCGRYETTVTIPPFSYVALQPK